MRLTAALLVACTLAVLFGAMPRAFAVTNACTTVTAGTSLQITAFSTCKKFTNSTSANECAITESSSEWISQYGNPPGSVTVGACTNAGSIGCSTFGGYYYNGYCYFEDPVGNQTCSTVCSNAISGGSCDANGTISIGSGDTSGTGRCSAVATGILGTSYTATYLSTSGYSGYAYGCVASVGKTTAIYDYSYTATTCAATTGSTAVRRFCACDTSTCGGTVYAGYCYYAGAVNTNCDSVCATHGGTDQAGIQYIGSSDSGSTNYCKSLAALIIGTYTPTYNSSSGYTSGCAYTGTKGSYTLIDDSDAVTTAQALPPTGYYRFCACAN